jgi:hypothetical protein
VTSFAFELVKVAALNAAPIETSLMVPTVLTVYLRFCDAVDYCRHSAAGFDYT